MSRLKRIALLEAAAKERGLTDGEAAELRRLSNWRSVRVTRLPRQIAAREAKLAGLRRELGELA